MPNRILQRVIRIISKKPSERTKPEVDLHVPWLRSKSQAYDQIPDAVLSVILKKCLYEKYDKDQVIVKQGDEGDRFYIILHGNVSIYVDPKLSGESGVAQDYNTYTNKESTQTNIETDTVEHPASVTQERFAQVTKLVHFDDVVDAVTETPASKAKRAKFGTLVLRLDQGKSFGELALLMDDNVRNATVIADNDVHLLAIPKSLFNDTIKAFQQKELQDCHDFVAAHPLFKTWPKKHKHLLEMSLVREFLCLDEPIVRQGQPCDGLVFIRSGRAKLVVEPRRHSLQYPAMAPFSDKHDVLEVEGFRKNKKLKPLKPIITSVDEVKQSHVALRRREGYAAVERDMIARTVVLCNVQPGEIIGDAEYLLEMDTYMQTAVCTTHTEVYRFTTKNMERLMNKAGPRTTEVLRLGLEVKLLSRVNSPQGCHIQLFKHLLFKLTDATKPDERPEEVRVILSKYLPDKEILFQQLLKAYLEDRAELLSPYVPGGVFYRRKMRIRNQNLDAIISNRPLRGRDYKNQQRKSMRQYQADIFRELEEFKLYEKERLRKRIKERKAEQLLDKKKTAEKAQSQNIETVDQLHVDPFFVTDPRNATVAQNIATKSDSSLKLPELSKDPSLASITKTSMRPKSPVVQPQQDYKIWHFGVRGYTMLEQKLKVFYSSDDCLPGHMVN